MEARASSRRASGSSTFSEVLEHLASFALLAVVRAKKFEPGETFVDVSVPGHEFTRAIFNVGDAAPTVHFLVTSAHGIQVLD